MGAHVAVDIDVREGEGHRGTATQSAGVLVFYHSTKGWGSGRGCNEDRMEYAARLVLVGAEAVGEPDHNVTTVRQRC